MNQEKINCPICRGDQVGLFLKKNQYRYFRCRNCSAVFIDPLPNLSDFAGQVYDKSYFVKENLKKDFGYANYDQDKKSMIQTFQVYLGLLENLAQDGRKILDVGAATGFFMKIALDRGWEAYGVEISDFASDQGAADGLKITRGTINDFPPENGKMDAITYLDVFEHLTNPKGELEKVKELLNPNGLILINTPDAKSLFAKISGRRWYSFMPPEHLILYNRKNLENFLGASGFEVLSVKKIGKKFSLPYIFQIMYNWLGLEFLLIFSRFFNLPVFNKVCIPLNVRDNFLIIARKKD